MYKLKLVLLSSMLLAVACSPIGPIFGPSEDSPVSVRTAPNDAIVSQNQQLESEVDALRQQLQDLKNSIEVKKAEERARLESEEATRQAAIEAAAATSREVVPTDRLWVTVSFRSGFMELTRQSRKALAKLASKFMSKARVQTLDVRGYTDDEPIGGYPGKRHKSRHPYKTNLALSEARAESVAKVLIKAGLARSAVHAQGYGASDFIASNTTASGRAKNRRTEIHLVRR